MNTLEMADGHGLISPNDFPFTSSQVRAAAEWVREQAQRAKKLARRASESAQDIAKKWGVLPNFYEAPESGQLLDAMRPVVKATDREIEKLEAGARVQVRFADELENLADNLAEQESMSWALRKSALEGYYADRHDVEAGRVMLMGRYSHLVPDALRSPSLLDTTRVWVGWQVWRSAYEANILRQIEAARVIEQIRDAQEQFAHGLQKIQDDGSGKKGTPGWRGRPNAGIPEGVPGPKWFEDASPEQVRTWWNRLSPAEQAAAADQIAAMDLNDEVVHSLVGDALRAVQESGTVEDVANLNAVLYAFDEDESAISGALAAASAGTVAAAIGRLGQSAHSEQNKYAQQRAMSSATKLREQVARASQDFWTPAETSKFADELVHVAPSLPASVGFLFADQDDNPMSAELAVAVANSLDRWERDPETNGPPYSNSVRDDGHYLAGEEGPGRTDDPMARVLQTLGTYPNDALDWLTDSAEGADRVRHYYGLRDSSIEYPGTGDGFEGVAALWAGAQQADGSLLDPLSNDQAVQVQVADLSSEVFMELAGNRTYMAETVSAAGSKQIARAVAQQLPQIAVNGVNGVSLTEDGGGHKDMALFEIDNPDHQENLVPVVNAKDEWIAEVIGPALTHGEGLTVMNDASTRYGQRVLESIESDSIAQSEAEDQVTRALRVDAALEGARLGALADAAQRDENMIRARVNLITGYASGKIPNPIGHAGGQIKGVAVNNLSEALVDEFSDASEGFRQEEKARATGLDKLLTEKANSFALALDKNYDIGNHESYIATEKGESKSKYGDWAGMARA